MVERQAAGNDLVDLIDRVIDKGITVWLPSAPQWPRLLEVSHQVASISLDEPLSYEPLRRFETVATKLIWPPEETEAVKRSLNYATEEARKRGATSVEPEHLLLALLRDPDEVIFELFKRFNVSASQLVSQFAISAPSGGAAISEVALSKLAKKVLAFAGHEAQSMVSPIIHGGHILLGIFRAGPSLGRKALEAQGLSVYSVRDEIMVIDREKQPQNATG